MDFSIDFKSIKGALNGSEIMSPPLNFLISLINFDYSEFQQVPNAMSGAICLLVVCLDNLNLIKKQAELVGSKI